MPQLILLALGAVGAFVVARWLIREVRRVNSKLDAMRSASVSETEQDRRNLKLDPKTGIYHPN